MNSVFIKEEIDSDPDPKLNQDLCTGNNSNLVTNYNPTFHGVKIKQEEIENPLGTEVAQYIFSDSCDQVQVKQEPSDISNDDVNSTTTVICNDTLYSVNVQSIDNVKTVKKHFEGECNYCKELFDCRESLVKHIGDHIIQQTCQTCNLLFSTHLEFIHHCKIFHSVKVKRPNFCDLCNKTFTNSSNLKSHQRTHTKERPYACTVCGKSFTHSSTLRSHQLTHTDDSPYICNVCNKSFTCSSNLKCHQRTHTKERPYVCSVCNKTFTHGNTLKSHYLTHTNERPFSCDVCKKSFTRSSILKSHALLHTNERPYVCYVCNKSFTKSNTLKTHQLKHAKDLSLVR